MTESKMTGGKAAGLTSSLMSRKGAASPAVPALQKDGVTPAPMARAEPAPTHKGTEWLPSRPDALTFAQKRSEPASLIGTLPKRRSKNGRVRISLRLDMDRHLRLKLITAHSRRTMQSVLLEALDDYFERRTPDTVDHSYLAELHGPARPMPVEEQRRALGKIGTELARGFKRS